MDVIWFLVCFRTPQLPLVLRFHVLLVAVVVDRRALTFHSGKLEQIMTILAHTRAGL
jgi:hypothetical protein